MAPARSGLLVGALKVGSEGDEQLPKDSSSHQLAVARPVAHRKSCACASFAVETVADEAERLVYRAEKVVDQAVKGGDDADPRAAS